MTTHPFGARVVFQRDTTSYPGNIIDIDIDPDNSNADRYDIELDTGLIITGLPADRLTPEHQHTRTTTPTTRDTIINTINGWVPAHDKHINIHALADDICEALHLDGQAPTP